MTPHQYLSDRLTKEMFEGNMHACLRDVGRLAGGLAAAGDLSEPDLFALGSQAEELAINKAEGDSKWQEAVAFGRSDPVHWDSVSPKQDKALDWDSTIGDGDYQIVDPHWVQAIEVAEPNDWDPRCPGVGIPDNAVRGGGVRRLRDRIV